MKRRRRKRRGAGGCLCAAAVFAVAAFAAKPVIRETVKYVGTGMELFGGHEDQDSQEMPEDLQENASAESNTETSMADAALVELPSGYDLRERRAVHVSDQGDLGTCWAFAALTAVETSMPESLAMPLSADHMSIHNSFGISQNSGGDFSMAMAYLLAWQGPVSEADDPYGDSASPDGLSPVCHVQEIRILPEKDYDAVKRAVYLYGGVQTSLYLPAENRRGDENVCYRGNAEPNHDAVIIGWDDDYPKENFTEMPESDGAFLCVNSWGEAFGDGGFFHVSYEDSRIAESSVSYSRIEPADNYDVNYQSDLCGWTGQMGFGGPDAWFANVYTAESEETLEAVGFYATAPDTKYEVYVSDGEMFERFAEDSGKFQPYSGKILASGTVPDTGFFTVKLKEPQILKAGKRFAVVAKIHTPGKTQPVAVEYAGSGRAGNVDISDGEGYISFDGSTWERTEESKQCNVCLKAYSRKNGK